MRRPSLTGKLCLLLLSTLATGVQARGLAVDIAAVRSGVGTLETVQATLDWPADATEGALDLRVGRLDFPLLSFVARDVAWQCPLRADGNDGWACDGRVQARGLPARTLSLRYSPASVQVELAGGGQRISYQNQSASPDLSRVRLQKVPVQWLQAFLAGMWADGQWTAGRLDGRIDIVAPASAPLQVRTDLQLSDVAMETPDGWLAAAGLGGRLELDYVDAAAGARVDARFRARGGEFLAQSFYAQLPADRDVDIGVQARAQAGGGWQLPALHWRDAGVLDAQGEAALAADGAVESLRLALSLDDLAIARDRYLSGFLAPAGVGDLVLAGGAKATLDLRAGELHDLSLALADVNAIDPRQRFTLAGLDGHLHWSRDGRADGGHLAWRSGALFGIGLGPARLPFAGGDGVLSLRTPTPIAVLGGTVSLDQLRWEPPGAGHGTRFQLGATLDGLDLGSLSQRLGWPPFTGTLGGRIPSARYEDNVLALDGGLTMQLFGGSVALSDLVMERPFGVAPTLSADVRLDDIDLEPLTAAFGFGSITGRLDGRIAGVRMVDWSPVAFDAWLQTDPAWTGRRRISQRAVEDISKVGGGGGLMGGLQAQALRLFDDFGYRRIGLGCQLRDNVCTMSGVDSAGDGYTIVEGSGLPRIQVVGFRRRVDWPTLVERLQVATDGQAPVID